jgi:DNA repair protein RadC
METTVNNTDWMKVAEIELIYRSKVKASERPQIHKSTEAYRLLLQQWNPDKLELQEQFKIMLLNRNCRVLGIYELSTGGVSGTVADPKLIFAAALKAGASSLIVCHNHPSGNLHPSRQDEEMTGKLKQAGQFLDINLMDHLIITGEGYYSFADEGLL